MASFVDRFDRTDRDLQGDGGWITSAGDDSGSGHIEIFDHYATPTIVAEQTVAWQGTTVPTQAPQVVSAYVGSVVEDSDAWVEIGVGAHSGEAGWAARDQGISARLYWLDDGVRRLEIRSKMGGGSVVTQSLDLVLAGGIEADGYEGVLIDSGAIEALQLLRLLVTEEDYGLLARAYVNETANDRPTLSFRIRSDWIEPDSTYEYGWWFFGFGPNNAGDLVLTNFRGEDYLATTVETTPAEKRTDQLTYRQLVEKVQRRYARSSNTNYDIEDYREAIQYEVERLINTCGDQAWFLRKQESLSITTDDQGVATMPSRVRRTLDIQDAETFRRIDYRYLYSDDQGQEVLHLIGRPASTTTYRVSYLFRHSWMASDDDYCPIPREHIEAVVAGACLRIAERDKDNAGIRSYAVAYESARNLLLRDMNRYAAQHRMVMKPAQYRSGRVGHYWT